MTRTRMVLPLRTFRVIFWPFLRRLAERTVTLTEPRPDRLLAHFVVPETRPVAVSVVRGLVDPAVLTVQVADRRLPASLHVPASESARPEAGSTPAAPCGPAGPGAPGVLGSWTAGAAGDTSSSSELASPVPAEFVAHSRHATRRPMSAVVGV